MGSEDTEAVVGKKFGFVDGERLIEYMRPHFMSALGQIVLAFVVIGALVPLVMLLRLTFEMSWTAVSWIVGAVIFLLLLAVAKKIIWWLTTRYVFTTHRIIVRTGLFNIKGDTVPLNRIQVLQFEKTLFDRILGSGRLIIDSAGENDVVIKYVRDAEAIKNEIYSQIRHSEDERDERGRNPLS